MPTPNLPLQMHTHLTATLLPFWKSLKDPGYGGYYGYMSANLITDQHAVKGCILNSRILWFFSAAWKLLEEESLREYATHAYLFLRDHCLDKDRGGVYWSVTAEGEPEDTTKHTYNQAFAIYALSAYYDASGDPEALQLAQTLFDTIETKCVDSNGYLEALDINFLKTDNDKLSENGIMADRTMNTLLHVFEAYTEYYRVSGNPEAALRLDRILQTFADKVYNPSLHRQEVFFDNDMRSLIDLHSYGHDIETAWLIDRGVQVLGDPKWQERMQPITSDLEQEIYNKAYDGHSLANECEDGNIDEKRVWWVQAEAVMGFYNAWEKNPLKTEYREAAEAVWEFIKAHLVDLREGSEWFWCTDREGNPDMEKPIVEPWKCPYHNGRMCMEIIRRSRI